MPEKYQRSNFIAQFKKLNSLANAGKWLFTDGTEFGAERMWWGQRDIRKVCHEGLDFSHYQEPAGRRINAGGLKVPPIFNGKITHIIADFLGESIFVAHPTITRENKLLYSIYGHCQPANGARRGAEVESSKKIAMVTNAKTSSAVPPHLHLSLAWIDKGLPGKKLNWQMLHNSSGVMFINPLKFIAV